MKLNNMSKQDFKIISEKLREVEKKLQDKIIFCTEHNFKREVEYLSFKSKTVREIRFEFESISEGRTDIKDADFTYILK